MVGGPTVLTYSVMYIGAPGVNRNNGACFQGESGKFWVERLGFQEAMCMIMKAPKLAQGQGVR